MPSQPPFSGAHAVGLFLLFEQLKATWSSILRKLSLLFEISDANLRVITLFQTAVGLSLMLLACDTHSQVSSLHQSHI